MQTEVKEEMATLGRISRGSHTMPLALSLLMSKFCAIPGDDLAGNAPRKLHLGCFDRVTPGWINTDVTAHMLVARVPGIAALLRLGNLLSEERYQQHTSGTFRRVHYLDLTRRFPLPDSSVDFIFASHVLEHLYPEDARFALCETLRVLKPGGILRIAVPDLDKMVRDYDPQAPEDFLEGIFQSRNQNDKDQHHWHYNSVALESLLKEVGFGQTWVCSFQQGRCPDLSLIENRPESLFVEAMREVRA